MQYGTDYYQGQGDIVLQPRSYEEDEEDYAYRPVSDLKRVYNKPTVIRAPGRRAPPRSPVRQAPPPWVAEEQQQQHHYQPPQHYQPQPWSPVKAGAGRFDHYGAKPKTDLGWTPNIKPQMPPHPPPKPISGQPAPSYVRAQDDDEGDYHPAWQGSLRSGRGAKVQDTSAGRSVSFQPQAHAHPPAHSAGMSRAPPQVKMVEAPAEGPVATHNPYNTPLGLYSKASAQEAMQGQLQGRPGEGTIEITGGSEGPPSFESSPTYRLVHRQDRPPSNAPRQSQAFRNLEEYTSTSQHAPSYPSAEVEGISEF